MPKKAFVHFFTLTFGLGAKHFKSDGGGGVKIMQREKFSFLKPPSVLHLSKWKVFNSIVCHIKINLRRKIDAETTSFVFLRNQRRGFGIEACCLNCLCDRGLRKSPNSLLFLKHTIFVFYKIIPGIILSTWLVASHAGVFRGARISSLPTNGVCGERRNTSSPSVPVYYLPLQRKFS